MPIAHSCAACGLPLTRVRAGLDPRLALQVVVCPECSTPCVRRKDPLARALRVFWRAVGAAQAAAAYALITGLLALIAIGISAALLDIGAHISLLQVARALVSPNADQASLSNFRDDGGLAWAAAGMVCGVVTGFWLTIALPHHRRRWLPWVVHALVVIAACALIVLSVSVVDVLDTSHEGNPTILRALEGRILFLRSPDAWAVPIIVFAPALLGWVLARPLRRRGSAAPSRRFARLRARLRKARVSA